MPAATAAAAARQQLRAEQDAAFAAARPHTSPATEGLHHVIMQVFPPKPSITGFCD